MREWEGEYSDEGRRKRMLEKEVEEEDFHKLAEEAR